MITDSWLNTDHISVIIDSRDLRAWAGRCRAFADG